MSPPATATLASPAVRPAVSVLMAWARTGPAASVNPAADAADAVMKPRRDSGVALVRPTISCILVCMFIGNLPVGLGDRVLGAEIARRVVKRSTYSAELCHDDSGRNMARLRITAAARLLQVSCLHFALLTVYTETA